MSQFIAGAATFGIGALMGYALSQASISSFLKSGGE